MKEDDGPWCPASGTFDGWPETVREITVLDPCMGSGHFLVFALPILVAMRVAEERLSIADAVDAVLRENLYGLEIDPRCTQIAAFNVAIAAWKLAGYRELPAVNLACSGLTPAASEEEWLRIADEVQPSSDNKRLAVLGREPIREGLRNLHRLFSNAPTLGSLIDPNELPSDLFAADFETLQPYLAVALEAEHKDAESLERAVAAAGMARAADILAGEYTLVITNVPYLGRGKQSDLLKDHLDSHYADGKADLATAFVVRCLDLTAAAGSIGVVTPQLWLFLEGYRVLRENLLDRTAWRSVARLGPGAFETISGEVVNAALFVIQSVQPLDSSRIAAVDASTFDGTDSKATALRSEDINLVLQADQRRNPDARITLREYVQSTLLGEFVISTEGLSTGDGPRFVTKFWEHGVLGDEWEMFQSAPDTSRAVQGFSEVVFWENGNGVLSRFDGARVQGHAAWRKPGILVGRMGSIRAGYYAGRLFDKSCVVLTPRDGQREYLPAIWNFCTSPQFETEIRHLDQKLGVATSVPLKVPFDHSAWGRSAGAKSEDAIFVPPCCDPTQWLFHGRPDESSSPLQVAVSRLIGYRWPAESNADLRLNQSSRRLVAQCEELLGHADKDGIVCISPTKGEASATDRITRLLADACGSEWSSGRLDALLNDAGFGGKSLDDWLRDGFFKQHCELFQNRPFIWHIWDGRRDGFHALVNYHRLAAGDGEGRRTLEKLIYSYLGDWIERQEREQREEKDGADARLTAAKHLRGELEKILAGEPPYDVFVRWKPLQEQPIGWEPDINDGVRLNIRPFMTARPLGAKAKNACILRVTPKGIKWTKDRGKEPERPIEDFPWFWSWDEQTEDFEGGAECDGNRWNDLHYSNAVKQAARDRHAQEAK